MLTGMIEEVKDLRHENKELREQNKKQAEQLRGQAKDVKDLKQAKKDSIEIDKVQGTMLKNLDKDIKGLKKDALGIDQAQDTMLKNLQDRINHLAQDIGEFRRAIVEKQDQLDEYRKKMGVQESKIFINELFDNERSNQINGLVHTSNNHEARIFRNEYVVKWSMIDGQGHQHNSGNPMVPRGRGRGRGRGWVRGRGPRGRGFGFGLGARS